MHACICSWVRGNIRKYNSSVLAPKSGSSTQPDIRCPEGISVTAKDTKLGGAHARPSMLECSSISGIMSSSKEISFRTRSKCSRRTAGHTDHCVEKNLTVAVEHKNLQAAERRKHLLRSACQLQPCRQPQCSRQPQPCRGSNSWSWSRGRCSGRNDQGQDMENWKGW